MIDRKESCFPTAPCCQYCLDRSKNFKKETSHLCNKGNALTGRQVVAWLSWTKEKWLALHDDIRLR